MSSWIQDQESVNIIPKNIISQIKGSHNVEYIKTKIATINGEIEPDGHGYELVSSVRVLVPQKFSVEEELMHVKHVEVKSPHVGVMWKFGRGVISSVLQVARCLAVSGVHTIGLGAYMDHLHEAYSGLFGLKSCIAGDAKESLTSELDGKADILDVEGTLLGIRFTGSDSDIAAIGDVDVKRSA
ncbi:hypothetical protein TNCV_1953311 [Trichonephila clavipes]|nr:hypothetical protein TNCV_1953311 [Trichonephila clavipes]